MGQHRRRKAIFRPSLTSLPLLVLLLVVASHFRNQERSVYQAERTRLEDIRRHAPSGSPEAFKAQQKLDRLAAAEAGKPRPEHPEEFARILYEMRVPNGRTTPAYPPGYRQAELGKARLNKRQSAVLPWIERGPGNVAGRTRGILVDPRDPSLNTWIVGSVGGGIWKTTNAGTTWTDMAPDLPNLATSALAWSESNLDIIYAGTGESFFNIETINGSGMVKSVDGGASWQPLVSTSDNPEFNNIARILVDPDDPDIVVVAATTGRYKTSLNQKSSIFKSIDGGSSWTEVHSEPETGPATGKVQHLVATPGNFNVLYAAVNGTGVLKSTDAGDTWSLSSNGITETPGRFELAVSPVNTNRIFASAEGSPTSNLWVSDDAGATWVETVEQTGGEPNWLGFQGWYDNTIVCHPTDMNTVYVGGIRLWKIQLLGGDERATSQLIAGGVHVDHHNLVVLDQGGGMFRLLNANDGGIAVSSSGESNWQQVIQGLNTTQFYGVDKRPGASAYVGGMQDNSTWRSPIDPDTSSDWFFQIGGDGYETSWHFDDPLKIVGGFQYNGLQRSLDGGMSWQSATNGLSDVGGGLAPFITKIAKTNANPELLFAVGTSGVWRSTDFAETWSLTPISSPDWAGSSSFTDVRISRANPDIVWAGARMDSTGRINVSADGGLSFVPSTNYTDAQMGGISGLSTHPIDDNIAYVLFSFAGKPKVLRTKDQGVTWEDISGFENGAVSTNGFPDVAVYDLLVLPHQPTTLWAGTEIGLFESTDDGVTWQMADNGLPALPIWFMTHVEDEVVLATHGRGVWSVSIPEMAEGEIYNPLVENLFQDPDGLLNVEVNLRSAYESSVVEIDGAIAASFGPNAPRAIEQVQIPIAQSATILVEVIGTQGGQEYRSIVKSIQVFDVAAPVSSYVNDFNLPSSDFVGAFTVSQPPDFDSDAMHTPHPYGNAITHVSTLAVPILVALADAKVIFDEVVLVETGNSGSVFGDFAFWDFVVVEGTLDGMNWVPLADGYDSRDDPDWLAAYNAGDPGREDLYRRREVDLLDTFSPGDKVLLRWRLFADSALTSWGWAVDNVQIQVGSPTSVPNAPRPRHLTLDQNYPNPFNPVTTIQYALPQHGHVKLKIYNARGREVRTLVDGLQDAGERSVRWDGRNNAGASVASGIYMYRLEQGELIAQRKMTLVK